MLLICIISSPNVYARSKIKVYEVEIVPPLPSYEESEYYQFNQIEMVPPPPVCTNKGKCCSNIDKTDCCFRKNKKNTIENQHAYIGIATAALLLIATLGLIFVARDSH